jgi:hypothetical protein
LFGYCIPEILLLKWWEYEKTKCLFGLRGDNTG